MVQRKHVTDTVQSLRQLPSCVCHGEWAGPLRLSVGRGRGAMRRAVAFEVAVIVWRRDGGKHGVVNVRMALTRHGDRVLC